HKKPRTVKNQIIQDIECRQLNLNDYESCLGEFFEESKKLLLDIDQRDLMQEALLKIARDPKIDTLIRYNCAKLLYSSTAKDVFDPNQADLAHRAAGITAIEEISRSHPIDILENIYEEENAALASLVLQKVKDHFAYKFCKSKGLFLENLPEGSNEVAVILRENFNTFGTNFCITQDDLRLDLFIKSLKNRLDCKKICFFIKYYFGNDPDLFIYFDFFKGNDWLSIYVSLEAIQEYALRLGFKALVDLRDQIVIHLKNIKPEARLKIINQIQSIPENRMNLHAMLFLLGRLGHCDNDKLPHLTEFLGRFSWNELRFEDTRDLGIVTDFHVCFKKMIQNINGQDIKDFEFFVECFDELKIFDINIKKVVNFYNQIYSHYNSVGFRNAMQKFKESKELFVYSLDLDIDKHIAGAKLSWFLDNFNYYVLHKKFSPFIDWREVDEFSSVGEFFKAATEMSKDNVENIIETMKYIQSICQNILGKEKLFKLCNTRLFIFPLFFENIKVEEYLQKMKKLIDFLCNQFGGIDVDDLYRIANYFDFKTNKSFANKTDEVIKILKDDLNVKNFLIFSNILENFNDEEYQQFLKIFSVDEIKEIEHLCDSQITDFIKFIMPKFKNNKNKIIIENIGECLFDNYYKRSKKLELLKKVIFFANSLPDSLFEIFVKNAIDLLRFGNNYYRWIRFTLKEIYEKSDKKTKKELNQFLRDAIYLPDENIALGASHFVTKEFEVIGLTEEDEFVQQAIRVRILLDQSDDPKNPYKIYRDLENKRISEISFENLRQFQFIKGNFKDYKLSLNPSFFKKLSEMQVDLSSAPFIDPMIIQVMLNVIEARLNPNLLNQIQTITKMSFADIKIGATYENNYLENLLKCGNSYIPAQLKCILNKLSKLEAKDGSETELSTQEMAIVKTLASILNCTTGRDGAINEAYLQLDNEFKLKTLSNDIFDSMAMDRNLATTPKACEFLYATLNGLVENMFSGTNDLMLEISQEGLIKNISQPVHQGLYLRNLIGDLVGSWHKIKFDLNAGLYYTPLLALSRQEALELFYKHANASLKDLITIIQAKINNQINPLDGAALYTELFHLLGEDPDDFELDEKDAPVITLDGTIKALVKIGALEQDDRLF
ncbi:MAG: hypothetical protein Q8S31_00615, partial [Alphaproteobacteria bacterium]|nr:hypothetical protein [Alphaproteobacteria bacterium]